MQFNSFSFGKKNSGRIHKNLRKKLEKKTVPFEFFVVHISYGEHCLLFPAMASCSLPWQVVLCDGKGRPTEVYFRPTIQLTLEGLP